MWRFLDTGNSLETLQVSKALFYTVAGLPPNLHDPDFLLRSCGSVVSTTRRERGSMVFILAIMKDTFPLSSSMSQIGS